MKVKVLKVTSLFRLCLCHSPCPYLSLSFCPCPSHLSRPCRHEEMAFEQRAVFSLAAQKRKKQPHPKKKPLAQRLAF